MSIFKGIKGKNRPTENKEIEQTNMTDLELPRHNLLLLFLSG